MTCQYNPALTRYAIYDEPQIGKNSGGTCQNEAVWRCGNENVWELCDECARLPIFKRLKKRVRIDGERRAA